jgi:hypothetical protein
MIPYLVCAYIVDSKVEPHPKPRITGVGSDEEIILKLRYQVDPS